MVRVELSLSEIRDIQLALLELHTRLGTNLNTNQHTLSEEDMLRRRMDEVSTLWSKLQTAKEELVT